VNAVETAAFLTGANQIDPRVEMTDDTVEMWHHLIGDLDGQEAAKALQTHYRNSTDRVMPADIRRLVNGSPDAGRLLRKLTCPRCKGIHEGPCGKHVPKPRNFDAIVQEAAEEARRRRAAERKANGDEEEEV
jgi:hypothetical protein